MPYGDDSEYGPGEDPTQGIYYSPGFDPLRAIPQLGLPQVGMGGGTGKSMLQLLGLLLAGGGAAEVGQQLFGKPPATQYTPRLTPQALGLLGGSQAQTAQSQALLQAILGNIQRPQIPPVMSAFIEQAHQPLMGDIGSKFIESIRRRGFAGGGEQLWNSGLGGWPQQQAVSDVQGQIAKAKLDFYQNNLSNLMQAFQGSQNIAQTQGQQALGLPAGQRTRPPGPSILDTLKGATGVMRDVGDIWRTAESAGGKGIGSWLSGLSPSSWWG